MFFREYYEIVKNSLFYRTPLVPASILWIFTILNFNRALENFRAMNDFSFTNFFSDRMKGCTTEGTSYCCFCKAVSNNYFQKVSLINFSSFSISCLLAFCLQKTMESVHYKRRIERFKKATLKNLSDEFH